MPIFCLEGLPGAGKSHYAVEQVLIPALKEGRPVIHAIKGINLTAIAFTQNLNLYQLENQCESLLDLYGNPIARKVYELPSRIYQKGTVEKFEYLPLDQEKRIQPNTLVIIDEFQDYFSSTESLKKDGKKLDDIWMHWLTHHRHAQIDLVYITQDIEQVPKRLRALTEHRVKFRNLGFISKKVFKDKYHMASYHQTSNVPYAKRWGNYNQEIYACYASFDAQSAGYSNKLSQSFFGLDKLVYACVGLAVFFFAFGYFEKKTEGSTNVKGSSSNPVHVADSNNRKGSNSSKAMGKPVVRNINYVAGNRPILTGCIDVEINGIKTYKAIVQEPAGVEYSLELPCSGWPVGSELPFVGEQTRMMAIADNFKAIIQRGESLKRAVFRPDVEKEPDVVAQNESSHYKPTTP